ncbi:dihydrofolate reductase family protein [Actinophytocola sp.]|uniref:dihydrofolate reductase family protein n=1 Tax=Actinophytocola sp. TaxID=1872138 RepID=UPI003D6A0EC4
MSSTVLHLSLSLNGFAAGPNVSPDNGLGDGGERLHEWPFPDADHGANRQIYEEFMSTGAIVAGSGSVETAGGRGGDYHDGVPIYIPSPHPAPSWAVDWPAVHYVSDIDTAIRDAKHTARDKNVLVHGASTARRALTAGLLDELEIHLIPVLYFGDERRELERVRVLEGEDGVTHLRYRVRR